MSRSILLRSAAYRDLEEAATWYDQRRRGLGLEFRDAVDNAFASVTEFPDRFPKVRGNIHCVHVRRFPYRIFYLADSQATVILAVFHVRRDPVILRSRG